MTDQDLDRNVVAAVEYAEIGPDYQRKVGEPIVGVRNRPTGPPELAEEDLLLGEVDKDGHGSRVFVAKGDRIPAELASLPRAPARPAPRAKK